MYKCALMKRMQKYECTRANTFSSHTIPFFLPEIINVIFFFCITFFVQRRQNKNFRDLPVKRMWKMWNPAWKHGQNAASHFSSVAKQKLDNCGNVCLAEFQFLPIHIESTGATRTAFRGISKCNRKRRRRKWENIWFRIVCVFSVKNLYVFIKKQDAFTFLFVCLFIEFVLWESLYFLIN